MPHRSESETGRGCLACELAAGTAPLPGGAIHRTAHWVVEHCIGPLGLGTVVVKPVRHVVHVAELSPDESAEIGPLLRLVSEAVTSVMRPEQVYVCLWSHAEGVAGHIHFVVQPALARDMAEHDACGPALQSAMFAAGRLPDAAEVERVCGLLRAALR
ncbi:hypothetical protein ACFU5O_07675 [Streptomyces sp. NPDC057445]|uniref:hypothetical protein n=1 Tax=Streptomyces sp. NPDC057445 TaxID=3346136 RepID=UPI0036B5B487